MAKKYCLVFVRHENSSKRFLYGVPEDVSLKKGDKVLVMNRNGETYGVCDCDSFLLPEDVVDIMVKELSGKWIKNHGLASVVAQLKETWFVWSEDKESD